MRSNEVASDGLALWSLGVGNKCVEHILHLENEAQEGYTNEDKCKPNHIGILLNRLYCSIVCNESIL